jgi:hypothetical protein
MHEPGDDRFSHINNVSCRVRNQSSELCSESYSNATEQDAFEKKNNPIAIANINNKTWKT